MVSVGVFLLLLNLPCDSRFLVGDIDIVLFAESNGVLSSFYLIKLPRENLGQKDLDRTDLFLVMEDLAELLAGAGSFFRPALLFLSCARFFWYPAFGVYSKSV